MASRHVLHVLPHAGGGAETYLDMLEPMPGFTHERFYLSRDRTPRGALASVPVRWPRLAARLRRADLLHTHGDVATVLALPLLRARPAVMTTHGLHLLRRTAGPQHTALSRALAAAVGAARAVICTSGAERDDLVAVVHSADRPKLTVIFNGIDPPAAPGPHSGPSLRDELGIGAETVLGLFVGQLEPRKAPLTAARAATRARAAGAPFVLAVAGEGPQAASLQALAGDAVKPLGFRSDLERLLSGADVFVAPSEREGMSLAVLAAMAHGLAVVASDGPGNPETVGDTALLFPTGDETALAAAITRLSADPALRRSLGASARSRALDTFGAERFLAATEAVYLRALEPLTAPAPAAGGRHA